MDINEYTLVVRAPNQRIEDVVVKCDIGWNVKQLKDHLFEVYPHKPVPAKQKLIYRGQLLNESSSLKEIFKNYDDNNGVFTIHLMCNTIETAKLANTSNKNNSSNNTNTSNGHTVEVNSSIWNMNNLQQNQQANSNDGVNRNWNYSYPTGPSHYLYGQLNDGQVAWVQQAYIQYLSQYMQMMASQGFGSPYIPTINMPVSNNANNPLTNEELQRQVAQNNPHEVVDNDNNNNNNADEAGLNRDWLDNFYMLSKIIVIFSIIYFHSSPLRFVAVTLLGFLLYLYQVGFFRTYVALPDNNNAAQANNNNQILGNDNPVQEVVDRRANIEERNESTTENTLQTNNNENQVQRPGALAFTWIFFSSFFASLIPD